ncbi:MAG TPA: hypothetical protein PKA82_01145 [Pyrinomonadaceae bacterium]|nr:hypothetical protein [Pyrinomonadaceae bacterium]
MRLWLPTFLILLMTQGVASQRPEIDKLLSQRTAKPSDLTFVQKAKAVADFHKARSVNRKVAGFVSSVKLSPADGNKPSQGSLTLFKPEYVKYEENWAYFTGGKGKGLWCIFTPTLVGTYLVDVSVQNESKNPTKYSVVGSDWVGNTELQQDVTLPGSGGHVTVVYEVLKADGKHHLVNVMADQDWRFYSCEISRVN